MNIAFCIGNGKSNQKIDYKILKQVGPTYGCNRLIEKHDIDNTVVVDKDTCIDLIAKGYNKKTNIYTRLRWKELIQADNLFFLDPPIKNPVNLWDRELQWGSGVHALNLAASHKAEIIIMIGYDLYNSNLDPSCWIYQIEKCLRLYNTTQFVQIQESNWTCPDSWNTDNFSVDSFKSLKKILKDLKKT